MAEFFENKDKSIMCPNCGRLLFKADKRDTHTHKVGCKGCCKWIWIVPKTLDYKIKELPPRESSSGKRFY